MSHRPRKRFGQNFLHDQGVITRILDAIDPQPGQHIVEIGPGQGALTRGLLQRAGELDAVELDRDLIAPLQRRCASLGTLHLHNADALTFDFTALRSDERPLRLVGNLPYNISTPLLFHLIDHAAAVGDMHFMLQKEVVDRMTAEPGSKAFGRLSVMVQVSCSVAPLFDVPPDAFDPPPLVDSSVARLVPLAAPRVAAAQMPSFCRFVRKTFGHRRKTLRNALKGVLTTEQIAAAGVDPTCRSEVLQLEQVIALHHQADTASRDA
ncbi:MAG: 16S rRNA (adenine(1518)-N(6)/adenine(1519)-N(6))-dimethyltransferase RsmA [Gammaproteobacteria bacterium]|nr:16S rRNA (adenine(1518)-N(6)/adenine(1519)-N(6))-dimethyltransferase RsmA [Gammaproteobacteria bacterium]